MSGLPATALDRARNKAYRRIIPLVFASYVIAYIDRANVAIAKLNMVRELPWLTDSVYALGAGLFFIGYFLLEIPGTLLVERWSARKWIGRIMVSWGIVAALTALVRSPNQFYGVRLLLGLAEAGFFPGVIVYFTHWFPSRDRARALSQFLIAAPLAQIISPKISNLILKIGTTETVNGVLVSHPALLGMHGWQWVYIIWGIPAVVLGVLVFFALPDRPKHAKWLTSDEREALEAELAREKALQGEAGHHLGVLAALRHPKVLLLALAYFFAVTANYGVEFFLPTILKRWYGLTNDAVTSWVLPPFVALLLGIVFVGWRSDRTRERWLHASLPLFLGALGLVLIPLLRGNVAVTVLLFCLVMAGVRGYLPAFWSLPNLFLGGAAAAGSIGFINSVGNLGGYFGPNIVAKVEVMTGSFEGGLFVLGGAAAAAATVILGLRAVHLRGARTVARVAPAPIRSDAGL
jgi:ACS family tartrate transporter-like MFS transporter